MNRAQRRQMMRKVGWRGNKAKRNRLATALAMPEPSAAQAEHEHRMSARRMGLLIPPTHEEAQMLRQRGMNVGAGGLILPR